MSWSRALVLAAAVAVSAWQAVGQDKQPPQARELAAVLEKLAVQLCGVEKSPALREEIEKAVRSWQESEPGKKDEIAVTVVDSKGRAKGTLYYAPKFGYVRALGCDEQLERAGPVRVSKEAALATARRAAKIAGWRPDFASCEMMIGPPAKEPKGYPPAPLWNFAFRETRDGLPTTNLVSVLINAYTGKLVNLWMWWEPLSEIDTKPKIAKEQAIAIALRTGEQTPQRQFYGPEARLWVRNMDGKTRLVWEVLVSTKARAADGTWRHVPGGEKSFWVDAHTGQLLHLTY